MMNPKSSSILTFFFLIVVLCCANFELGFCRDFGCRPIIRHLTSSSEVESVARFAVEEHNKRENTLLRLRRVLKVKEQVVAGKIYHLTLEVVDAGKKTVYEAKVWVKPWMNFKQLQEFKRAMDISHIRIADLRGVIDGLGWHKVSIHDPDVQDAANHAVKFISERSNCICPHELLEILQAEIEVVKDFVNYNLHLKLENSNIEQKVKTKLRKTADGRFFLDSFEPL